MRTPSFNSRQIASYVALRPHLKEQMDRLLSITGVNLGAAAKRAGRSALYGTGFDVQGRKLKSLIAKQAAADAERLYAAIVDQRERHLEDPSVTLVASSDLVFDPTRPSETDWERILSQHTERLLVRYQKREAKRPKPEPKPDIL